MKAALDAFRQIAIVYGENDHHYLVFSPFLKLSFSSLKRKILQDIVFSLLFVAQSSAKSD
jgi:hypothetical protein